MSENQQLPDTTEAVARAIDYENNFEFDAEKLATGAIAADRKALAEAGYEIVLRGTRPNYDEEQLRAAVMDTIGQASVCWTETPSGVFRDDKAQELGESLLLMIRLSRTTTTTEDSGHDCDGSDAMCDGCRLRQGDRG